MKQIKPDKNTRYGFIADGVELRLIRGGKQAYLWIGNEKFIATFSGPAALRALARHILAELPLP